MVLFSRPEKVKSRLWPLPFIDDDIGFYHYTAGGEYFGWRCILHKFTYIVIDGGCYHFFWDTGLDNLAVPHDGDATAQFQGFIQVMGYEQDCLLQLRLHIHKLILHLTTNKRVQSAERFIH